MTVTARSRELLSEHREQLEALTRALLEAETLDSPEAYAAAGLPAPPDIASIEPSAPQPQLQS